MTGGESVLAPEARSRVDDCAARLGDLARRDVPIGPLTTYRVGGAAAVLARVEDPAGLARVRDAVVASGVEVLVVGNGSNLLVADTGFPGLAVQLGAGFAEVDLAARPVVRAGGAVGLPVLARQLAAADLVGFEWAVGVPGSVGGAVRMNAGGHGSDMAGSVVDARVLDLAGGRDGDVPLAELAFAYRSSSIRPTEVVCSARLGLAEGDGAAARERLAEIVRWRREHQPGGQNAGSVFTNPEGDSAGRLIDAAGAKGLRIGTAHVSEKHANFIQADEGGRAADVLAVLREAQRVVQERTGVRLHPELRLVGFPTEAGGDPSC